MRFTIQTATMISPMNNIAPSAARTIRRMLEEESTVYHILMLVCAVLRFRKETEVSVPEELMEILY